MMFQTACNSIFRGGSQKLAISVMAVFRCIWQELEEN